MQKRKHKAGRSTEPKRLSEAPVAREPLPLCSANSSHSDITRLIFLRLRRKGNSSQSSDVMITPGKAQLASPAGTEEPRMPGKNQK